MEPLSFKQHERLLMKITWRVLRRVHSAGCKTLTHQDLMQEAAVAWCKARDNWNPEFNVPFAPYLTRGVLNHLNRFVQGEINQRLLIAVDIDSSPDGSADTTMHEVISSETQLSVEDQVVESDIRAYVMQRLSPVAKIFVELLSSPPQWLVDEFNALRARSEYARTRGIPSATPRSITNAMIMDFLGLSRTQRHKIYLEIKAISEEVQQQAA